MHINVNVTEEQKTFPKSITILVTGMPKSGKTTNAIKWNDGKMLVLDCENGTKFIKGANNIQIRYFYPPTRNKVSKGKQIIDSGGKLQTEVIPPNERGYFDTNAVKTGQSLPVYALTEAYEWLQESMATLPYEGYIIDTLDDANNLIEELVKQELNISSMGEAGFGADYGKAKTKMMAMIMNFIRLCEAHNKTLILIAHSKISSDMNGIKQQTTVLPSGMSSAICSKADLIGFTQVNKQGEFIIKFKSSEEKQFGSRIKALSQKELPFDYHTICAEYDKYMVEQEKTNTNK